MIEILSFDPLAASDQTLQQVHRLYLIAEAEDIPEDPPVSYERRLKEWFAPSPGHESILHWIATEDGVVMGTSWLRLWRDHDEVGLFWASVDPAHRRRGIATAMGRRAIEALEAGGRAKPIIDARLGVEWEDALERHGFRRALSEKISRLYLADVDWSLMQRWIDGASDRASEYDLVLMESPFPDAYLEEWCRVLLSMNDAPREELELDEMTMNPAKWRGIEESLHQKGDRMVGYAAVHRPTGVFAGLTDVVVRTIDPYYAEQDDTVVHPDHRNKGLGRLLKATMIKHLASSYPEIEMIDTGNAASNEPMLNINVEMGFRTVLQIVAWQGDLADIKTTL